MQIRHLCNPPSKNPGYGPARPFAPLPVGKLEREKRKESLCSGHSGRMWGIYNNWPHVLLITTQHTLAKATLGFWIVTAFCLHERFPWPGDCTALQLQTVLTFLLGQTWLSDRQGWLLSKVAFFPGPRVASCRLQYCKWREADRGPGNEAMSKAYGKKA